MFCDECTDLQKAARGCTSKATQPINLDGEIHEYCPVRDLTRLTSRYLAAYAFFSKDILPCSGGWGLQGNKGIEAVLYLNNLQNKSDRNKSKKDKTKKPYAQPGAGASQASKPKPPTKSFKQGRPSPQRSSVRAKKA